MKKCVFCKCVFCFPKAKKKFTHTWFSDVSDDVPCEAWIDYAKGKDDKFLWYAFLSGDQYTKGHTLVVLGPHRSKITDPSLEDSEVEALALGLKKVSTRLKDKLGVDTVHVLSLCEGIEHLHFHLIPRHRYTQEEKIFYICHYWDREKDTLAKNCKRKCKSKKEFIKAVMSDTPDIHGMWYAAYHEMKFKTSDFSRRSIEDRVKELEATAKCLRDPNLRNPFK